MPSSIETIAPGRARAGETLTINGSGFGGFGHNVVRVDDGGGFAAIPGADVTTIDTETITFVMPAGLARDRFISVEVTNNEDNTTATWWFYSQLTLVELETDRLPFKVPGFREGVTTTAGVPDESPGVQEAKDWNRLAVKSEMAQYDLFTTLGDIAARGTNGMRRVPLGTDGQRYYRSPPTGAEWRTHTPESVWWGGQLIAANVAESYPRPQNLASIPTVAVGLDATDQSAVVDGFLALLMIHVTDESTGFASRVSRVRIFVNDVVAFDSDTLDPVLQPFIFRTSHWTLAPWLEVNAGDRIRIGVTKNNATNTLNVIARAVLV